MILLSSDENKLIVQPENLDPGAAKKKKKIPVWGNHAVFKEL